MKKFLAKGLMALLPLVLTAVVLYLAVGFLYNNVGIPIGQGLKWIAEKGFGLAPPAILPDGSYAPGDEWAWFFRWGAPLLGFCVAFLLTLVMGFFVATFLGSKLYKLFEALLSRLPVVKVIYPYARQFTDFFFSSDEKKPKDFKHAVAVPFPTQGIYSIGFVTGEGMRALNEATGKTLLCVFVPTSPAPFTGYVVYVPKDQIVPLPLSIEEAMRVLISAGVIHPDHQRVPPAAEGLPLAILPDVSRALPQPPGRPE